MTWFHKSGTSVSCNDSFLSQEHVKVQTELELEVMAMVEAL